jgi:NitT/TauT family transport system permease protein
MDGSLTRSLAVIEEKDAPRRPDGILCVAALAWLGFAAVSRFWPDIDEVAAYGGLLAALSAGLAALVAFFALPGALLDWRWPALQRIGPWLVALAVGLTLWELVTAKLLWLPRPFFAPPQALLEVYIEDWPKLLDSLLHSMVLLACGYVLGAASGFVTGVAIGWSRAVGYWVHPLLRLIGPLPATAWLPLMFFIMPSSWSAAVCLIGLASGFPVAILTWSGVSSVDRSYYDISRTLGAGQRFLVLKVAIPAALPHVFVGLFMGLGASFTVLIVAEMMGVKAGLGWYLQWAQGWAAYSNMYAALLVMALVFSSLITLLFRLRNRLLAWQKGLVQW